jgi:hypothetical protein
VDEQLHDFPVHLVLASVDEVPVNVRSRDAGSWCTRNTGSIIRSTAHFGQVGVQMLSLVFSKQDMGCGSFILTEETVMWL